MAAEWFLARRDLRCGGCGLAIALGTPTRQLRSGLIRCVACTKKLLDEDPPQSLEAPSPAPRTAGPRSSQPFVTPQAFVSQFKSRVLGDHKTRAAGGDDER